MANNGTVHWGTAFLNQQRKKFNLPAAPKKGAQNPLALPPPPQGTYDPSLDYNAQASSTGLLQTTNDAETAYSNGQQDYGLNAQNLLTQRNNQIEDIKRNYNVLGHQQADHAAQQGITSAGLLALSAQKRMGNENFEAGRVDQGYNQQKTLLDLANARQFGGFEGHVLNDPLTGQPIFGTLATQVARAGGADSAYQNAIGNQKAYEAQQNNYIYTPPKPTKKQAQKVGAYIRTH